MKWSVNENKNNQNPATTTTTKNQTNKHDPNVNVMRLPNGILTQYL